MKKIITLFLGLAILTGCSTKISLVKRKYNKGFFVSTSGTRHVKPSQTSSAKITREVKQNPQTSVPVENVENTENTGFTQNAVEQNNEKGQIAVVKNKTTKQTPALVKKKQANAENEDSDNTFTTSDKKYFGKAKSASKAGASDENTLILVILAIFPILCLIAVYLKDNKSITLNFWVDLLLHLTAIGEIVFAILVVLDILSLA